MDTYKKEKNNNNNNNLPFYPPLPSSAFPYNCEKFIKFQNGKIIYATKETLEREEKSVYGKNTSHRLIQTIVAISSLKETIATTLLFKGAYLSIFAKGDDKMIFDRIENTIEQLNQVLENQTVTRDYELSPLFFCPPTMFQIISNEIVEHFRTAIYVIKQCILGRESDSDSFSSRSSKASTLKLTSTLTFLEKYTQTWKWTGWKQIGMTALCSLSTVKRIISDCKAKFGQEESVKENLTYLEEFDKIATCLTLIVKGFMAKKYPSCDVILSVFKDDDVLNEEDLRKIEFDEEDVKGEKDNERKGEQRGTFSRIFGGVY